MVSLTKDVRVERIMMLLKGNTYNALHDLLYNCDESDPAFEEICSWLEQYGVANKEEYSIW